MQKLLNTSTIIIFFYYLLFIGTILLVDYYLFWIISNYISIQYFFLGVALFSGVFTFLILNSITDLIKSIKKKILHGETAYPTFTLLLVTIFLGILLIMPGLSSTGIGLLLYLAPIRKSIATIIFKLFREKVISLFSVFLYENI